MEKSNHKKGDESHVNITLSFPSDLNALLRAKVANRGISKYVSNAVREALQRDEYSKMQELEEVYEKASRDPSRIKALAEWKDLDLVDDSEGWEW